MGAAILRPRRFIVTRVERSLFAVADRTDARGVDAEGLQVFLGDVRALVAEGEVVLLGAALVENAKRYSSLITHHSLLIYSSLIAHHSFALSLITHYSSLVSSRGSRNHA